MMVVKKGLKYGLLVKQGNAMVMTIPPNVKYAETFVKLERRARKGNRGLWNEKQVGH